jgi:hypothetical protein
MQKTLVSDSLADAAVNLDRQLDGRPLELAAA